MLLFLLGGVFAGRAEDVGTWRVWVEPKFMRAPQSAPIPEAKRTELAAGRLNGDDLEPLRAGELESLGVTWADFAAQARLNADLDWAHIKVDFFRNRKKVIEYAELTSEAGLLPSAILSSKAMAAFSETLGPTFVLLLPSRSRAFAFPKLVSNYQDYMGPVLELYREARYKVSLEVFEVSPEGLKAIGFFPDPARD